jgi:5'(3')-deoxyribonucleotidase
MTDVYLAEACYKSKVHTNPEELEKLTGNYSVVLAAHNITQEEFEISHAWWWEHPAAMKGVLQEVTEKIIAVEKSSSHQTDSK